jgi:hypothetical protein
LSGGFDAILDYVDRAAEAKSPAAARRASKPIIAKQICGDPTAGDG